MVIFDGVRVGVSLPALGFAKAFSRWQAAQDAGDSAKSRHPEPGEPPRQRSRSHRGMYIASMRIDGESSGNDDPSTDSCSRVCARLKYDHHLRGNSSLRPLNLERGPTPSARRSHAGVSPNWRRAASEPAPRWRAARPASRCCSKPREPRKVRGLGSQVAAQGAEPASRWRGD